MKLYILLLVILLSQVAASAQPKEGKAHLDSMMAELSSARYQGNEDTGKIKLLGAICYGFSRMAPKAGIRYGEQALKLAEKLHWKQGIARSSIELGCNYEQESNFVKALEYELKALKIYEELGDQKGMQTAYGCMASVYYGMDDAQKALTYDSLALSIATTTGNKRDQELYLGNMTATYARMGKIDRAVACAGLSIKTAREVGDKLGEAAGYQSLGATYGDIGDRQKALENLFKARALYGELGDKNGLMLATGGIGNEYLGIVADSLYRKMPGGTIPGSRAECIRLAVEYTSRTVDAAKEIGDLTSVWRASMILADAYALAGDGIRALDLYKQSMLYKDSLQNNDSRLKIAALETAREKDLKEKEITLNKLEAAKKQNERVLFSAALVLLAVGTGAVYKSFKAQRKTNEVQREALAQKEVLMKEIHHRVKNNLQVISTLLDLQLVNVTDEQAKEALTESNTRLRAISLIHQQLYQDNHVTTIEFSQFALDLQKQIGGIFSKRGQEIAFSNNIAAGTMDIDTAVPLGMILNELITNSYKYAFGSDGGDISISTQQRGDEQILVYRDSGPGIPEGFDVKKSKSLGMRIVNSLSKQLGGTFIYNRDKNEFVITFKDLEARKLVD